ncbi:glycosyltransferase family 39 protein [Methanobrevibacter sp.]
MNIFNDLNLNKKDIFYLIVLLIINLVITAKMIIYNLNMPIYCADVIVYMVNALNFANSNPGLFSAYSMFLSPVICFLTSILIRLSITPELSIFIITGVFGIIGNLGLYVLFKNRFSPLLSLLGSILYSSFSIVLFWWANGTIDTSAVAISIWILIFTILAVDKNPKYYLIAIPLFVFGFFTRYTVGFILPLMLLYFLSKHDIFKCFDNLISDREEFKNSLKLFFRSKEFIYLVISIIVAALISAAFLKVILTYTDQLMFLTQAKESATGFSSHTNDLYYNQNYFFYATNFLRFLFCEKIFYVSWMKVYSNPSIFSYVIIAIMAFGLMVKVRDKISNLRNFITESFKTNNFKSILIILMIFLFIIALLFFKKGFLFVDVPILIIATILFSLHKTYNKFRLSLLVLMWFLIYFIFFSLDAIKVDRYILTVMPAFVYFFIYFLDAICERFSNIPFVKVIPAVLIIICLILSFNFTETVENPAYAVELEEGFNFLIQYDDDYQDKEIISVLNKYASWYLQKDIDLMTSSTLNLDDSNASYVVLYNRVVDKNKDTLTDNGFKLIYHNKEYAIFGRQI